MGFEWRPAGTSEDVAPKLLTTPLVSHDLQSWGVQQVPERSNTATLRRMRRHIDSLCGIYSRVARRIGVDRTYVSRVAKGERRSPPVERALLEDFKRVQDIAEG